jgi:hypothetical protein
VTGLPVQRAAYDADGAANLVGANADNAGGEGALFWIVWGGAPCPECPVEEGSDGDHEIACP